MILSLLVKFRWGFSRRNKSVAVLGARRVYAVVALCPSARAVKRRPEICAEITKEERRGCFDVEAAAQTLRRFGVAKATSKRDQEIQQ